VARDRRKNVSALANTDVLLDVLGNETRRRILDLISHEPMYFNQLAKEIRTGQQAILCHIILNRLSLAYRFLVENQTTIIYFVV